MNKLMKLNQNDEGDERGGTSETKRIEENSSLSPGEREKEEKNIRASHHAREKKMRT